MTGQERLFRFIQEHARDGSAILKNYQIQKAFVNEYTGMKYPCYMDCMRILRFLAQERIRGIENSYYCINYTEENQMYHITIRKENPDPFKKSAASPRKIVNGQVEMF